MPGPPPQRDNVRILKGNGRDRDVAGRQVKRQPRTVAAEPTMPDGLGPDGQRVWGDVAPELVRMGIFGRPDQVILEAYCRTYDHWRVHDGGRGYPALTMTLANLGSKLGLDPASRLRMTLPEAPSDEESDVFGAG